MKFFKIIEDFLLPATCPICHQKVAENLTVCAKCFSKLEFIGARKCSICGRPLDVIVPGMSICGECMKAPPYFHQAEAVFRYSETSKKLILAFKHGDHIELTKLMTKWMANCCSEIIRKNEVLVPIPLYWTRLLKRKYNQSALLAKELAKKYGKIYDPMSLVRIKATVSQGHLSPRERQKNIQNAFRIKNPNKIKGKTILLIDDVYTTGATVNECAKVLLKAGAKSVDVLTFARVVKE